MKKFLRKAVLLMGLFSFFGMLAGCKHGQKPNRDNTTDEITRFYFSHNGMSADDCYSFSCERDGNKVKWTYEGCMDEKFTGKVDVSELEALQQVFKDNQVANWNGFHGSNSMVLDGSGYSLSVAYADGSSSNSSGSNNFPDGYGEVSRAIGNMMKELVEKERQKIRDRQYLDGKYTGELTYIGLHFKQQGQSGSDAYDIVIRDEEQWGNDVEITVKSVSGEYFEKGDLNLRTNTGDTSKIRAEIAAIFEKYEVGKWDGFDKAHKDYGNQEWFQFSVSYPEVWLNCYGTEKPEHYDEVRAEVLRAVADFCREINK